MIRAAAFVLATLFATESLAFRGRPVNDLRFEDRSVCETEAMATDGSASLIVCVERIGEGEVYGQLVRADGFAEPMFLIASGRAGVAATWNGSNYIVAVGSIEGLFVTTVTRGGAMSPLRKIRDEAFFDVGLATSGARTLLAASLAGDVVGYVLDANAVTISFTIPLGGILDWDVAPLGNGFAFAQFGQSLTTIVRLAVDGTVRGSTTFPSPPGPRHTVMTSNGSRLLLLFTTNEIRTAVVNGDGVIERLPATIYVNPSWPGVEIRSDAVAWTGADYLAAIRVQTAENVFHPYVLRVAATGERLGSLVALGESTARPAAAAMVGGRATVAFASTSQLGSTLRTLDGSSTILGRRVNAHTAFAIASHEGQYLAAWVERHDAESTIRASRIDRNGAYLDGAGIVLGRTRAGDVAAAWTGTSWLVLWADDRVRAVHLSRDARVLDASPIDLGEGHDVEVAQGTSACLVVISTNHAWWSLTVDSAGRLGERRLVAQGRAGDARGDGRIAFRDARVAFDGSNFLSLATEAHTTCDPVEPACASTLYLTAARFDHLGALLEQPLHRFAFVSGPSAVAGGNGSFLLLMRQPVSGDFSVTAMMMDGWLPPVASARLVLGPGHSVAAAWDGHEFVAAWIGGNFRLQLARITSAGIVDGPRTMPGAADAQGPQLVADASTPALLGYLNPQAGTDDVPRVAMIFAREIDLLTSIPLTPAISSARRIGKDVRVRWAPVPNAFGVDVELLVDGGGYRRIATAPGTATEIVVPMELRGDAIRLRAWNSAGFGPPSLDAWITNSRVRSVRP